MPDFSFENAHNDSVCGLDEVGRAPLAGPVVAACVYIPDNKITEDIWNAINDSKLIAKKKREILAEEIKSHCHWAIAEASAREIEAINIVQASFLAMERAFLQMSLPPLSPRRRGERVSVANSRGEFLALIDGNITPQSFPCAVQTVVKGDTKSVSIAAASIIAKTYRDNLMSELAEKHPYYGWERNAGYPTPEHLAAINKHGITDHHRKTFAPVRKFLDPGLRRKSTK